MNDIENQAIETEVVEQPIETTEETKVEEKQPAEDQKETDEIENDDDDADDDTPFPKKATRALERRNKKINKLRSEKFELEQRLREFELNNQNKQVQQWQPNSGAEPKEDDFENYADYLKALGAYEVRQEYAQREQQSQFERELQSQTNWVNDNVKRVDARVAQAVETIPDLNGLYLENQDVIEGYSDATKYAFLEAERPELAFYAFAKEGRLEELDSYSPTRLAREIALAEIRGEKLSKNRPISKAPAPIKPLKTGGTRAKSLSDMSPTELLEYLKKQRK